MNTTLFSIYWIAFIPTVICYPSFLIVNTNVYHFLLHMCSILTLFSNLAHIFNILIVHQVLKVKAGLRQRKEISTTQLCLVVIF